MVADVLRGTPASVDTALPTDGVAGFLGSLDEKGRVFLTRFKTLGGAPGAGLGRHRAAD